MSDYTESRNEEMIRAIIDDTPYHTDYTQGRNEQILQSIIDNTPYDKEPESRMEELLIELKQKIEGGGGEYQAKTVMPDFTDGDVIITPDSEYSALSSVTVEKDTDLIAGNIKKDVEIFGVTGSYEMPADIETDMNAVLNKKMGTATTYAPNTWADTVNLMGKLPEKTATGAIASFDDGADDVPIAQGLFDIVAIQEGTGDPSPNNIRPISGFNAANGTRIGKNLFDINMPVTGTSGNNYTFSLKFKPNTKYTCSSNIPKVGNAASIYFGGGSTVTNGVDENTTRTMTSSATGEIFIAIRFRADATGGVDAYDAIRDGQYYMQIEEGETATTYEPYNSSVINVDWTTEAGTVYGGTLNATTGVLTVTWEQINLGSLSWTKTATAGIDCFQVTLPNLKGSGNNNTPCNMMCEQLKNTSWTTAATTAENLCIAGLGGGGLIAAKDDRYSTAPDFKQAMSGIKLVYELATPQTYQLTPTQINTLLGVNNIYCDTGDSSVTYREDIDLALQNL